MLLKLREHPQHLEKAASWFSEKWDVPLEAYCQSMKECIQQSSGIPQWYILTDQNQEIIAGAGVIANDFHERSDLTPNLCALFVEEQERGQGHAKELLKVIRKDLGQFGFQTLYLLTDHTSFYEKCGWTFLTMVKDSEGHLGRMYQAPAQ